MLKEALANLYRYRVDLRSDLTSALTNTSFSVR